MVFYAGEQEVASQILSLNESGVLLWHALENGVAPQELAGVLTAEYDVSESVAAADAAAFLEKLKSVGCLEEG